MTCPTTETLERFALGFLEDPAPVKSHLAECAACVTRLDALAREHDVLTAAAKAVSLPKLKQPAASRPPTRWLSLSLAACVLLALCLVWIFSGQDPLGESLKAPLTVMASEKETGLRREKDDSYELYKDSSGRLRERVRREKELLDAVVREERYAEESKRGAVVAKREPAPAPTTAPVAMPPRPDPIKPPVPAVPAPAESPAVLAVVAGAKGEHPADMRFKDHGLNPIVDTAQETKSTFGLDVDTASYTIMRNFLNRNHLPPQESVRVEEYLNYFRYADPKPQGETVGITLEAAPSPFNPERHLLRIALQAKTIQEKDRKDLVLTFVIDISGSMAQENRLGLVKQSLRILVDRLRPTDKVGIVVFSDTSRKLLDPTPVAKRAQILGIIDELQTQGGTSLQSGMRIGYDLAARHFNTLAINRVILCTDGVANNGVTDPVALLAEAKTQRDKGIYISALGFGMGNYNDELLEKLANSGNGNYAYIDDLPEAKKLFVEKLSGMMEVVAADAKVQVEFDPQTVATFRLVGYEGRHIANENFRNDKVDAGEVGAGHHVTALYEIQLKRDTTGRLAVVRLRYREPDTKEVVEDQRSLSRGQVRGATAEASASFRLSLAVMEFAEILRGSPLAQAITMAHVVEQAALAARDLDNPDDAKEFVELVKKAATLQR